MAGLVEQLDAKLEELLKGWNGYTTLILVAIVSYVAYSLISAEEPDTHPMILLRQSSASQVRNPGESAIYRSPEVPHGYPLKTGLSVKPPGAPAYAAGKDGDLRDVWRRATGVIPLEKNPMDAEAPTSKSSKILTVLGREEVVEHDLVDMTWEIAVIGDYIRKQGGRRVAIYLPNCVEFLQTLFAAAFYGLDVVLIPYNQPHETVGQLLRTTKSDALIAEAGSIPLDVVSNGLKQIIWVVEKTSRHVDWTEVPENVGGKIEISQWHELLQDTNGSPDLPDVAPQELGKIVTVWQEQQGAEGQIVEFTQKNLVAAIGAAISALPTRQRMTPSDLFLPADSLTHTYTLTLTLAALFSHASVAINSVSGPGTHLELATRNIAPTVVVISAETAVQLHSDTSTSAAGGLKKLAHAAQTRALQAGRMPADSLFTRLNAPTRAAVGNTPGKLRLVFVSEKAGTANPPLTSNDLSDLRVFTGARVLYTLTSAQVAGAVAQTSLYDYRRDTKSRKHSHFGVPLSSVEVKLVDKDEHKTSDEGEPRGAIIVTGPAVAGGEANIGVLGRFRDDCTLAYV